MYSNVVRYVLIIGKESGDVEGRTPASTDSTECINNNLLAGFVIPLQVRDHSTNSGDRDELLHREAKCKLLVR